MSCKIKDLCERIGSGGTPSRKNKSYYNLGNIKWLKTKELDDIKIYDTEEKITEEGLKKSSAKLYPKDTIVMAMYGATVGKLGIIKEEMCTNQACCNMVVDSNKCNYKFLYYSLLYNRESIINLANGAAQQNLSVGVIGDYEINLPSLEEQEKIADILSSLDDKVELNNEMNKTLEEMAQSIFKRWFVDFEFPNDEGQPYKSSGGEMVDSEFGMIPNGWEVKNLDEVLELIIDYRGKTPKKLGSDWSDEGIMALSAKHIKDGNLVNLEVIKYVSNELYEKWMKDKLKMGDIIMTSEAPVGELYYINTNTEYCLSQRVYGLRSNKNILKSSLLYYMLDSKHVKGQILNRSTGTTVVGIRQTELRKVNVIVPPMNIQESISILLDKILSKKEILDNENTNLAQIRNSILPKLMNGEIKIGI